MIGTANCYYDLQNIKKAVHFYKKAIDIDPNQADVYYNLGNSLYLLDKVEEAIRTYKKAVEINPRKVEAFYNLGNAQCGR